MSKKAIDDKTNTSKLKSEEVELLDPKEAVGEDPKVENLSTVEPQGRFNSGKIVWGFVFIFFGLLLLLGNLGVLDINWLSIWKLWPLAIILAGVSILDIKGWVGMLITFLIVFLSGGLILTTLTGDIDKLAGTEEQSEKVTSINIERERDINRAKVNIDSGAGRIDISDHRRGSLVKGKLTSVITQLTQESEVDGRTQEVNLSLERGFQAWGFNPANNFDLSFSRSVPIDLTIESGASSVKADLEHIQARSVSIDAGASSVWLKLGGNQDKSRVEIDTGASSVEILIPKEAGVKLELDAGLSSRNLPSDFEDIDDGIYRSEGYDESKVKFDIKADLGVSSFKIVRY